MKNPEVKSLFLGLLLSVAATASGMSGAAGIMQRDTLTVEIAYRQGIASLELSESDNEVAINRIVEAIRSMPVKAIDEIIIVGGTSPEGKVLGNSQLSELRTNRIRKYLSDTCSLPDTLIKTRSEGARWEELRDSVVTRRLSYAGEIRRIVDEMPEVVYASDGVTWTDSRKRQLMDLRGGTVYNELLNDLFPILRQTRISLIYRTVALPDRTQPVSVGVEDTIRALPAVPDVFLYAQLYPEDGRRFHVALKNNLLYDMAFVANLGVEFNIGRHISLDFPLTFSPYELTSDLRIKTFTIQPSCRYWFRSAMSGLFVSIFSHFGYYDIALCGDTRWRNYSDTPMFGYGAGIGYSHRFRKDSRWGIEAELGGGYANLMSDYYYNVPDGTCYYQAENHYWGLTKANVGISYILNMKKLSRAKSYR